MAFTETKNENTHKKTPKNNYNVESAITQFNSNNLPKSKTSIMTDIKKEKSKKPKLREQTRQNE